jgi:CHAT domain-containing protein
MMHLRFLQVALALCLLLGAAIPGHSTTADDVHRLLVREQYDQAIATAKTALAAAQGETNAAKQQRLYALNLLLDVESLHNSADGVPWAEQVLALERELHGENSRGQIKALTYAAVYKLNHQQFRAGLEQIEQAQKLAEHGTGTLEDVDRAYLLKIAAWFEHRRGNLAKAVELEEQSTQAVLPLRTDWQRVRYINSLWVLATYQNLSGKGDIAVTTAENALALATKVGGQESSMRAHCLHGLGEILYFQGNYLESRKHREEALAIERQRADSPAFLGDTLDGLAETVRALGETERARELFDEALTLAKTSNQGKFGIIVRMNNLAELELEAGKDAQAREWFERILAQEQDSSPGAVNPHLFLPLYHLGTLALRAGDVDGAFDYFTRAQNVLGASVGADNGEGPKVQQALGEVALSRARPAEAEGLLTATESALAHGFGTSSPEFLQLHCDLALAKARQNKLEEAFALTTSVETERIQLLSRVVPALSERQALRFKATLNSCASLALTLAATGQKPEWASAAWELAARARGLATRLEIARLAAVRRSASAATKLLLNTWENTAQNYANALASGAEDVETSQRQLEAAEAALGNDTGSRALSANKDASASGDTWRHRFAHDTVIAYVKSNQVDIAANAASLQSTDTHLYAFVSASGAVPRVIDLGSAVEIEALSARWYALLRRAESDAAELNQAGLAVRARLWDPLGLDAPQRVFVVNDGPTYRLNFAALPDRDGFLIERGWRFHALETEYDAVRLAAAEPHMNKLLLVGAIDYGATSKPALNRDAAYCGTPVFEQLPGAARELDQLSALWKTEKRDHVTILRGSAVDEASVRRTTPHADIVHFATHAFNLGSDCATLAGTRGVHLDTATESPGDSAVQPAHVAALALSDANTHLVNGTGAGLLTPEKIVAYPLADVSWVILAACDTGLGNVVGDEGVFGLRRAFRVAGAHTVVMSLWSIEDSATTGWMTALYRARLAGQDTVDAMASAQLATLAERREHSLSVHPYFWAGFVAAGDWR